MWFAPISERKQGRGAEQHLLVTKVCVKDLLVLFFYAVFQIQPGSGFQSGQWFRIRIRIQEGKKHKNRKGPEISFFEVLDVLF
jgi:hypothetical protein